MANVARVVREDDGTDANAEDHGGRSYATFFGARGDLLPSELLIGPSYRIDVRTASDEEVLDAVARVVAQYVRELVFLQDPVTGRFDGSPYDVFLRKNGLPAAPASGETDLDYARRLRSALASLASPSDVTAEDGHFEHHAHAFRFGTLERRGLAIFLSEPPSSPLPPETIAAGGVGSCVRCHAPPDFTDFLFHDVGVSQAEYDAVHGDGAFLALPVPDLGARNGDPAAFLPPSPLHPDAAGPFRRAPAAADPGRADLGLWNVFANPEIPRPQNAIRALLLRELDLPGSTPDADLLPRTLAWFKTPALRDTGHGDPYFHSGRPDTLEDVLHHYIRFSALARADLVRNGAPELRGMALVEDDVAPLAAFLRALDEDYE